MKSNLILLLLLTIHLAAYAGSIRGSQVPAPVINFVKENYKGADAIIWDYDDDDRYYEAEFEIDGLEYELEISPEGKLLYSKEEILIESVPAAIKSYLAANYKGYEILGAKKITRGESVKYNIGIAGENSYGHKRHRNITFNKDGKVIKR